MIAAINRDRRDAGTARGARWRSWVAVLLLVSAGCSSPRAEDTPAVLLDPTPAARAELERTISEALHGAPVTLADDALTRTSLLAVERPGPRDLEQRPLGGRVLEPPQRFQLLLSGTQCVLVHVNSGTRRVLSEATCQAE